MPGIDVFTRVNLGKETTKGTPVARTRRWYGVAAGNFELGDVYNFHETENRGQKIRYAGRTPTLLREAPQFKLVDSDGVDYDSLVLPWSIGYKGGLTGVGASADKTWTFTPVLGATNAPEAATFDVGDDTQNYILNYGMISRWMMSTQFGEKTHFEADVFGRSWTKGAASTPAETTGPIIPADLWTVKFAATVAGLGAASVQANFLRSWSYEYVSGFVPRWYADGTTPFGQHVEKDIVGTLTMEVESTALAVSEFVDKQRAGTLDCIRLKVTGPVLGGTFYSITHDLPVYYDAVKPIASVDDGINLYTVSAHVADDGTNHPSTVLVCSLAAIP